MATMPAREKLRGFVGHVKSLTQKQDDGLDGFDSEYMHLIDLQVVVKLKQTIEIGIQKENLRKNRYKDILPYDAFRVPLPEVIGPSGPIPGSGYINASFIKDPSGHNGYIAAMGPVSATVLDFWRMIWHYQVQTIVMLCNYFENGKKKCAPYLVDAEHTCVIYGDITVTYMERVQHTADISSTVITVTCKEEMRVLRHFHFQSWPDHGVPASSDPIVELIQMVRDHQPHNDPPIVVHCSAGCGRTGTVIAVDFAWQLIEKAEEEVNISLSDIVGKMREQRVSMVQTKEQYVLIYRAVLKLAKSYMRSQLQQKAQPSTSPAAAHDLYGNAEVLGVKYGQQVTALGPKTSALPESPYFTVRADEVCAKQDAEESDLMAKLSTAAAATSSVIYEKEVELTHHDHDDDTDEKPPAIPVRRQPMLNEPNYSTSSPPAGLPSPQEDTYQLPPAHDADRPRKPTRSVRRRTGTEDEPPPLLPVKTQDSYQFDEAQTSKGAPSTSPLAIHASSRPAAQGSAMAADYSSIHDCLTGPPSTSKGSEIPDHVTVSRQGSCSSRPTSIMSPTSRTSSMKLARANTTVPVSATSKGDPTSATRAHKAASPMASSSGTLGQNPKRESPRVNAHGLKRIDRPKGPRPLPSHWKPITV